MVIMLMSVILDSIYIYRLNLRCLFFGVEFKEHHLGQLDSCVFVKMIILSQRWQCEWGQ